MVADGRSWTSFMENVVAIWAVVVSIETFASLVTSTVVVPVPTVRAMSLVSTVEASTVRPVTV
jgi:hypothetical protein